MTPRQRLAADRAAKVREHVHGWQPIDTAPRDLSAILLFDPDYPGVTTGQWEMHAEPPFWSRDVWDLSIEAGGRDIRIENPTHWMPLPDDPKSGDAE